MPAGTAAAQMAARVENTLKETLMKAATAFIKHIADVKSDSLTGSVKLSVQTFSKVNGGARGPELGG